jgi:outer membrane protein
MHVRFGGLLAALVPAAFVAAGPAWSQQNAEARTGLSAAEVMAIAERAEAAGDTASAIAAYGALANDPDVDVRNEARFRHGRLLAASGDLSGAALLYRRILDEKPDAARVRIELAAVLARMGDEAAARRELRQAQATGLPAEVALAVDQFAAALRARKPFGASLSVAIVPDSNINRATSRETLDTIVAPLELSQDAREQSGLGVRVGGQVYARVPLAANLTLVPRVSGQAELYRQSQFNDVSISTAVGLEWTAGRRDRLQPALAHTNRYYGGELYAQTSSAVLNWVHGLGRSAQLDTTATAARADYRTNDLQDGWLLDVSATYEQALSARSGFGVTLSATRQTARDPGYATISGGISAVYGREVGAASLFANVGVRQLEADERLFLFSDRRREWLYSAGAGGSFRKLAIAGFAPLVRLSYERNVSTVGIYDYSRFAADFGITRAF